MMQESLGIHGLENVIRDVGTVCDSLGIDYFIAGTIARNVEMLKHGIEPKGTQDVDFIVHVPRESQFQELKQALISKYNYHPSKDNKFCVIRPDGIEIDLLPFGSLEITGEYFKEGIGLVSTHVNGLKDVFYRGLKTVKLGETEYQICNLPSIVLLKFIAYQDRPDRRLQDLKDIDLIVHQYPTIEADHIWSDHTDLYAITFGNALIPQFQALRRDSTASSTSFPL